MPHETAPHPATPADFLDHLDALNTARLVPWVLGGVFLLALAILFRDVASPWALALGVALALALPLRLLWRHDAMLTRAIATAEAASSLFVTAPAVPVRILATGHADLAGRWVFLDHPDAARRLARLRLARGKALPGHGGVMQVHASPHAAHFACVVDGAPGWGEWLDLPALRQGWRLARRMHAEACLAGLVLVLAMLLGVLTFSPPAPHAPDLAGPGWRQTTGTVRHAKARLVADPAANASRMVEQILVEYEFLVNGRVVGGTGGVEDRARVAARTAEELPAHLRPGAAIQVVYNPANPRQSYYLDESGASPRRQRLAAWRNMAVSSLLLLGLLGAYSLHMRRMGRRLPALLAHVERADGSTGGEGTAGSDASRATNA